jgi:hypothetical protein
MGEQVPGTIVGITGSEGEASYLLCMPLITVTSRKDHLKQKSLGLLIKKVVFLIFETLMYAFFSVMSESIGWLNLTQLIKLIKKQTGWKNLCFDPVSRSGVL